MSKLLKKYSGVILLYSMIIVGVIALNARFAYLNQNQANNISEEIIAFERMEG